jgi:predicted Co/Zn/Cd cation transporter (cation efflux family)
LPLKATTHISTNTIERQALKYGAAINLLMAFAGWLAYYLSRSQALFLDGNFSFLMFVSLFVAIKISAIKGKKTELFPYGQFVYEALYSLLKGIMITGVLLVSFIQNTATVFHYISGGEVNILKTDVILWYAIAMVILCFGSALYYRQQNKKNKQQIEGILQKFLFRIDSHSKNYISKTGSSYLVVAYLNTKAVTATSPEKIERLRQQVHTELQLHFPHVLFEIVLS